MCEHCGCGIPAEHSQDKDHAKSPSTVRVEQDVLAHERAHAASLRVRLEELDARLVNVIGSPGCGKTELLAKLIPRLHSKKLTCSVIEGDLATDNDAKRIGATGAPVHQVTTGTACHLTAHNIEHALEHLPIEAKGLILVENVGNLVCPSMFDLGESLRIVCLSVTEGTDKPEKYPIAFREAGLAVITKHDLIEHVNFDVKSAQKQISDINPKAASLVTSAHNGKGLDQLAAHIFDLWNS